MSTSLKFVLIVIAIAAVGGFYLLKQNEARFQSEFSPHKDLSTMLNTGQVELKTFNSWCKEQGHQGPELERCVTRRKARAAELLELEKNTAKRAKEESAGSHTPAENPTAPQ